MRHLLTFLSSETTSPRCGLNHVGHDALGVRISAWTSDARQRSLHILTGAEGGDYRDLSSIFFADTSSGM